MYDLGYSWVDLLAQGVESIGVGDAYHELREGAHGEEALVALAVADEASLGRALSRCHVTLRVEVRVLARHGHGLVVLRLAPIPGQIAPQLHNRGALESGPLQHRRPGGPLEHLLARMRSPATNHQSPITHHQSPITNHRSPITDHRSPITNHRSPITNQRPPITNHQSAGAAQACSKPWTCFRGQRASESESGISGGAS
eukprot:1182118-Prorocentrum_minimum.AAC.5